MEEVQGIRLFSSVTLYLSGTPRPRGPPVPADAATFHEQKAARPFYLLTNVTQSGGLEKRTVGGPAVNIATQENNSTQ